METKQAVVIFEALSSGARLDVFRLLVKAAPHGLVAGEIAKQLAIPSTNLSFHLKALLHSGLVGMEKEGRFWRYRADISLMLEIIAYLTAECCTGVPGRCGKSQKESGCVAECSPYAVETRNHSTGQGGRS